MMGYHGYGESEEEKRERELGEGLSEWERDEHSGISEQELSRLKNTIPLRVFRVLCIVVGVAFLLLIIVSILGVNVFHF